MSVYLDASVIVSLFIDDAFAARAEKSLRAKSRALVISDYAAAEFASSISRNVRMKILTKPEAVSVFSDFDRWSQGTQIVQMESADVQDATAMLRRLDLTLRAPDAIHIAISNRLGAELATFDKRMADSARILGAQLARV